MLQLIQTERGIIVEIENILIETIIDRYPQFKKEGFQSIYVKKLSNADVVFNNKEEGTKGSTAHIAVTGDSRNFFKKYFVDKLGKKFFLSNELCHSLEEEDIDHILKLYGIIFPSGEEKDIVLNLFVEKDNTFIESITNVWIFPKKDKDQLGLSKIKKDGKDFLELRNQANIGDVLFFFNYKNNLYVILLKSDKDSDTIFKIMGNSKTYSKYLTFDSNQNTSIDDNIGSNLIFYGAPGTGKSYGIQKYIQDVFRTTFHPEYGYSDFVGQIMPTVNEEGQLEYIFNPGSFTQAIVYAYRHPDEPVFLILEEMSRANCASVFGDIFQLLDRNGQGESEYPINHLQLSNYLQRELGKSHPWNKYQSKIYIPGNLYLIGTMNTSDQNVFVMDTAFKRRFLMKYVPTTIDSNKNQFSLPYSDTETMEWNDFVKTVNDYIVDDKGLQLSEDKQLGQFFMKNYDAKDAMTIDPLLEESKVLYTIKDSKNFETYKDKVLYYLYHDVEKASYHTEKRLFNENIKSFGDLYQKATAKNHYDIYSEEFKGCLEKNMHSTKDVSYNMDDEIEENE
ncbi:McrB family protein [Catellicoccus marimammalium]|uniref:McrB family protein n=1 Tax=Catellicoccus marimammalium TaxID=300419 RepID=UPI000A050A03|nr:AAA family ATPase [Catellicoccus marimammalium]